MPLPSCPDCGFSFAWNGRACGHCRGPRTRPDERRVWWERTDRLSDLVGTGKRITPRQLRRIAVGCLRRVQHLHPDDGAAVDELDGDTGPGGPGPAAGSPLIPSATDPGDEVANAVRTLAVALRGGDLQPWTVLDVAGRCAGAAGYRFLPARAFLSLPLPPELERHRAAVAEAVAAAQPAAAGGADWWPSLGPLPRPPGDPVREAHEHLVRAASEHYRQRQQVARVEEAAQCGIARDVLGDPEAVVRFEPDWRTGTALALAREMTESRDYSPMPILADALQDAGCDDDEVLTHCRSEAPHYRGCWVLDLVLDGPRG